jgi:hypothetical protein
MFILLDGAMWTGVKVRVPWGKPWLKSSDEGSELLSEIAEHKLFSVISPLGEIKAAKALKKA